jgi:hypothetical protein
VNRFVQFQTVITSSAAYLKMEEGDALLEKWQENF